MGSLEWTDYEFAVADAVTTYPQLLCFDAVGLFIRNWDNEITQTDSWRPGIVRVDVCQVDPLDAQKRRDWNRKFRFNLFVKIVAKSLGIFPDKQTIVLDMAEISEETALTIVRRELVSREYTQHQSQFLWGPVVTDVEV
jgi:hypothetical protein